MGSPFPGPFPALVSPCPRQDLSPGMATDILPPAHPKSPSCPGTYPPSQSPTLLRRVLHAGASSHPGLRVRDTRSQSRTLHPTTPPACSTAGPKGSCTLSPSSSPPTRRAKSEFKGQGCTPPTPSPQTPLCSGVPGLQNPLPSSGSSCPRRIFKHLEDDTVRLGAGGRVQDLGVAGHEVHEEAQVPLLLAREAQGAHVAAPQRLGLDGAGRGTGP